MALQLSSVPFKLTPEDMGVPNIAQGQQLMQNFMKFPLENRIAQVQAQYAPQTAEANIFHQMLSPLAQLTSNPLVWGMMTPEQQSNMSKFISNFMGQTKVFGGQGLQGGIDQRMQIPGQQNVGVAQSGYPVSNIGGYEGNISSRNPALVPGGGGNLGNAITSKIGAEYAQQPYAAGKTFVDPATGKVLSAPTETSISVNQSALQGIRIAKPLLEKISKEADEFLKPGGKLGLKLAQGAGVGEQYSGFPLSEIIGADKKKVGKYNEFQSDLAKAQEVLMRSFNLPNDEYALRTTAKIVQPGLGEDGVSYYKRIMNEAQSLSDRYQMHQANLAGGYNVTPGSQLSQNAFTPNSQIAAQLENQNKLSAGSKALSKNFQFPEFKSQKEFQTWYKNQDKTVQNAARLALGGT